MIAKVNGSQPFKVLKNCAAIGPTTSGYVLCYATSKDGEYSAWDEATPANEVLVVNDVVPFMWLKLSGNTDTAVEIIL